MPETVETVVMRFEPDDAASKRVEQTAQRLAARVQKLKSEIKALRDQAKGLNAALDNDDKAFKSAIQNTVRLEKARKSLRDTEKRLRDEFDRSAKAQREQAEAARLYGDVESRARAITGAIGYIGGTGIERTVNIGAEALASAEAAGLLKLELPELARNLGITKNNVGLLAAELGLLGVALVIGKQLVGDIIKQADATKATVIGQIDALEKYNEFIQDATAQDLQARLTELAQTRTVKGQFIEDLYVLKNAIEQGLDIGDRESVAEKFGVTALKTLDLLGVLGFGLDEVDKAINQTTAELQSTDAEFRLLTQAYMDGATAASDAAALERTYTKAKIDGLERRAKVEIDAARMTEQQVDDRLDAIATETAAYRDLLDELRSLEQTDQVVAKIEAVNDTLDDLSEEARLLDSIARPLAQAHDAVAKAEEAAAIQAKELAKNVEIAHKVYAAAAVAQSKLSDELSRIQEDRAKLDADYARESLEIQEDRDLKLVQEAEKFALERVNDLADHYKDLAELDHQFYQERGQLLEDLQADLASMDFDLGEDLTALKDDLRDDLTDLTKERLNALRDYNKAATRAAEDHYKRLQQIQDRANSDIRSAAAKLDAVAIFEAKQNAEEQLAVEHDRYQIEQKRREEDFRDQQRQAQLERRERIKEYKQAERDLRDRYAHERQQRIQAYRLSLRELEQQHNRERQKQIAAFNEKIRREDQQRALERQHQQQAYALEDQRRQQQYQSERAQLGQHYSRLLTLNANGLYQIEIAYQAWLNSMAARTGSLPVGIPIPSSPIAVGQAGGFPPLHRDVLVGERGPEIVRFRQPARLYAHGQKPGALDGASIVINVDGSRSPMQVGYAVRKELEKIIKEQ